MYAIRSYYVFFYLWKQLPYHHAIWHLFVLAGSILHYFAIYYGVLPHSSLSQTALLTHS